METNRFFSAERVGHKDHDEAYHMGPIGSKPWNLPTMPKYESTHPGIQTKYPIYILKPKIAYNVDRLRASTLRTIKAN